MDIGDGQYLANLAAPILKAISSSNEPHPSSEVYFYKLPRLTD